MEVAANAQQDGHTEGQGGVQRGPGVLLLEAAGDGGEMTIDQAPFKHSGNDAAKKKTKTQKNPIWGKMQV